MLIFIVIVLVYIPINNVKDFLSPYIPASILLETAPFTFNHLIFDTEAKS